MLHLYTSAGSAPSSAGGTPLRPRRLRYAPHNHRRLTVSPSKSVRTAPRTITQIARPGLPFACPTLNCPCFHFAPSPTRLNQTSHTRWGSPGQTAPYPQRGQKQNNILNTTAPDLRSTQRTAYNGQLERDRAHKKNTKVLPFPGFAFVYERSHISKISASLPIS